MTSEPSNSAREKAVAFVVARLSSSRLPAKQLRNVGERPLLAWVFAHLRQCREVDEIVLATVAEEANEPLREFARTQGVKLFWYEGEVDHVTTRLRCAAEAHGAEICLLVSGDCPMLHAAGIDALVKSLRENSAADVLRVEQASGGQISPLMQALQVARKRAWQRADSLSDRPELKEHQFPIIAQRPELFHGHTCRLPQAFFAAAHRISVDTPADLEFMNRVHDRLVELGRPFDLVEGLRLLDEEPEIGLINRHVHQRRLVEIVRKALFAVDVGGEFGYGHFMRCLEVASQLVERHGWPVTFLVDDDKALDLLRERGFGIAWGAFAREARSGARSPVALPELIASHDLLVVDIFDRRGPEPGWRKKMNVQIPVAVVDNTRPWVRETDLVIVPGVTDPGHLDDAPEADISASGEARLGQARFLKGLEFVILRREVRRAKAAAKHKDLNLLAYLHNAQHRQAVSEVAAHQGLQALIPEGFATDFPLLLARSRVYLSGFGYSFYEALALGCMPVAWPDSEAHRRDVRRFFERMGLPACLVENRQDLESVLSEVLQGSVQALPNIKDGTPALVGALAALVTQAERKG